MTLSLRPVTSENWDAVARLEVRDNQRHFVAPNSYSLAQAAYETGNTPVALTLMTYWWGLRCIRTSLGMANLALCA